MDGKGGGEDTPFPWDALFPELKGVVLHDFSGPLERALLAMTCKKEHRGRSRSSLLLNYISRQAVRRYLMAVAATERPVLFHWFLKGSVHVWIRERAIGKLTMSGSPLSLLLDDTTAIGGGWYTMEDIASAMGASATVANWTMFSESIAGSASNPVRCGRRAMQCNAVRAISASAALPADNIPLLEHVIYTHRRECIMIMRQFVRDATASVISSEASSCLVRGWLLASSSIRESKRRADLCTYLDTAATAADAVAISDVEAEAAWFHAINSGQIDVVEEVGRVLEFRVPLHVSHATSYLLGKLGSSAMLHAIRLMGFETINYDCVLDAALVYGKLQFLQDNDLLSSLDRKLQTKNSTFYLRAARMKEPWANDVNGLLLAALKAKDLDRTQKELFLEQALLYHPTHDVAEYWTRQLGLPPPSAALCARMWPNTHNNTDSLLLAKLKWILTHRATIDDPQDALHAYARDRFEECLVEGKPEVAKWYAAQVPSLLLSPWTKRLHDKGFFLTADDKLFSPAAKKLKK